jgi:hypothetical protein
MNMNMFLTVNEKCAHEVECSTTHNRREYNPTTHTHTCCTTHNRREYSPTTQTHMHIKGTYILTTYTQRNRRQQFDCLIILMPDDDHIV